MPVVKFEFRLRIGSIKGDPDLTGKFRAVRSWFGGGKAHQLGAPAGITYERAEGPGGWRERQ
jgi:hypothetical protein